jgi:O-methyltransferase
VKRSVAASGIKPFPSVQYALDLLRFGDWIDQQDNRHLPRFDERFELYQYVHKSILKGCCFDFLEFGVFQGDSLRFWVDLAKCPQVRFFGFDSFRGLPENWILPTRLVPAGHFDVGGALPDITDPRVRFIPGLFQDTCREFLTHYQRPDRLVLHLDADLFSSTLYVLATFDFLLKPGDVLIMDELNSASSEFRALMDYLACFRRTVRLLAHSGEFVEQAAVEIVS